MLFQVPMAYDVEGVPKGKRNPSKDQFWEWIEVDIPVLDDDTAPVSARWDDSFPVEDGWFSSVDAWNQFNKVPDDGIQVARLWEGRHYLKRPDGLTAEGLSALLTPDGGNRIFKTKHIYKNRERENPVSETPYRSDCEFSSTREDDIAALRAAAARLFIAGGHVYELSSEPVVIKDTFRSEEGVNVCPRIVPRHKVPDRTPFYRLDRYDEVVHSLREIEGFLGRKPRAVGSRPPEILVPEAFTVDDTAISLVNAARHYVGSYNKHQRLVDVDPALGIAFLRIKQAVLAWDATDDTDEVERRVSDLIANHPDSSYGGLEAALKSYQERPVDIGASRGWSVSP